MHKVRSDLLFSYFYHRDNLYLFSISLCSESGWQEITVMVWTALWGVASAKPIPDGVIVEGPPEEHHPHEQVTVRFVVCHARCGRSGDACVSGPRCRCEGLPCRAYGLR